jgi:UDP-glucose 4-epimerase
MEKIVITGGLGYIGTELCKLYSGETRYKNIIVTDKKFISERVKQLRDWGFNFIQGDILDNDFISNLLKDTDIVYHLAGVTDVAYTKLEEKFGQNELIKNVGVKGSLNIINNIPKHCKIIFPSTHVVYEGFKETKYDVSENEKTTPILTYSKGKDQTEKDLKESNLNYIILRLASVYGYSTDTMRMGIMPNLFSKIASQNGTIKLFSGGIQLKSLVPLIDVARCFKFMAENKDINKETFHLSKENMTVKEVAELCKKINPNLTLEETDDEIPNLGYTISNKKLLSTGFKFRYNLEQCLKEMINNWSKREINPKLEYTIQGGKEYIDERGKISNYELTEPINLIGYIESKKYTVRANHYHPIQEQKCLLVKGKYISVIKDLSDPNSPIQIQPIHKGDIAVIKPNVAHTMVFLEDSIFLNLVRGEREHENYGVTHTIPYELVDENLKKEIIEKYLSVPNEFKDKNFKKEIIKKLHSVVFNK